MAVASESIDDLLGYLLPRIRNHKERDSKSPFVIGLTGLQGSGKSTWAAALHTALERQHHQIVVSLSLDDLYHSHDKLIRIQEENPDNTLLQSRGQPGTHDEELASEFFSSLSSRNGVLIPSFDKSLFNGQGDRRPREDWKHVPPDPPIDIVIFEGWCVGFLSLDDEPLRKKWEEARLQDTDQSQQAWSIQTLGSIKLEHLYKINSNLRVYNETFLRPDRFHSLIHLDTENLGNVYNWRLQQEHALWRIKGEGMTDNDVMRFVKGYMPSYELYLDQLRHRSFPKNGSEATHLRVLLDKNRIVIQVEIVC